MDLDQHGPTMRLYAQLLLEGELAGNRDLRPTDMAPLLRIESGRRVVRAVRWGLVPSWASDVRMGAKLFNARSETAAAKPSFREAMKRRRGVVLCDGFYEWSGPKGARTKHWIGMADGSPVLLAGLWERWTRGEAPLETCTVLTCAPNELLAPIHDRMPVILAPADVDRWLDPGITDAGAVADLLVPYPAEAMRAEGGI